ncbi:MAG: GNAT family N-acetyltransferase [Erythrobacter sp.]
MSDKAVLLDRIMAVMEAAFDPHYGEAWNRRQVSDALAIPSTHALVVDEAGRDLSGNNDEDGHAAAGFVLTRAAVDEEELLLIAVMPRWRRTGLGAKLIERLFEKAAKRGTRRIFLEMRRGNPAEYLYRAFGFEPIGKRTDYYRLSDGSREDAITFGRQIA